jgi:hypothetical protein
MDPLMITPFAKTIVVAMLCSTGSSRPRARLIVFGVVVRLVMWPLTTKSFRSIQAMQKVAGVSACEQFGRPDAAAAGNDEAVQGAQGEPAGRVSADAAAVPDPHRPVLRLPGNDPEPAGSPSCGSPTLCSPIRGTSCHFSWG